MFGLSHTILIILITIGISLVCLRNASWFQRLALWGPGVRRGQVDRLITHGFVHVDGWHLFFNMFTLFFFGRVIEQFYRERFAFGDLGFVIFYLMALVVAGLPSLLRHLNNPGYYSVGASGAVNAVLFAYILFAPWQIIYIFFIPIPAILFAILYMAYSVWAAKTGRGNINHEAHITGAIYGVLATLMIEPELLQHFTTALLNPRF